MSSDLVDRFVESLAMNHDRWRDGEGYALDLLDEATSEERARIESLILSRQVQDWRDIEALGRIDSEEAREKLRLAWHQGDSQLRLAIATHARELVDEAELTELLVRAMGDTALEAGFSTAMLLVADFHPPAVIDALVKAARDREGPVAYDCAAHLLCIHGFLSSPYDFAERPFLLRFVEEDRTEAIRELCARIGVAPPSP